MDPRWIAAAETARSQYGVATVAQLIECGFSRSAIARAAAKGHLFSLHRGVFAVGHVPIDLRAHRLAATLACGPSAVLSHSSDCEHLGILRPRRGPIDVTVPTHAGRKHGSVHIHRARLGPGEVGVFEGIPCTSPSRALLDIAATRPGVLKFAIKEAGGRGLLDVADVLVLLDRHSGCRGTRRLRDLLVGHKPIPEFTRSLLEILMYELCRDAGIECPRMNQVIPTEGEAYECDCVWPAQRLIIECDSRWHDNPVTATGDALKDEALALAGWRVQRLRWAQIVLAPARAARHVRLLLAQQERLLAAPGERGATFRR